MTSSSHTSPNNGPNIGKLSGILLVSAGILIIVTVTIVWFSIRTTPTELQSLNVEYKKPPINIPLPLSAAPNDNVTPQVIDKESSKTAVTVISSEESVRTIKPEITLENEQSEVETEVENFSKLLEGYGNDSFLKNIAPKSWSDHDWLLPDDINDQLDNFDDFNLDLIDKSDITVELISGLPEKISIPILGLTAPVENLEVVEKDGRKVYETPKNLVGRIPSSPEESDSFKGWYFGHLESPIKGEGNVFHDLPEIAEHLLNGNKVLISLEKSGKQLVYQATQSEVVHESELKLYDPGNEKIVLVTCSNRPLYDHRQLVTATLVGQIQ